MNSNFLFYSFRTKNWLSKNLDTCVSLGDADNKPTCSRIEEILETEESSGNVSDILDDVLDTLNKKWSVFVFYGKHFTCNYH